MAEELKKARRGKVADRRRFLGGRRGVSAFALVGLMFLLIAILPASWAWPTNRGEHFTLHFFDVGQGDSALAQCGRTQALIDGGPDRIVLGRLGRAMPFTDRRIEYVILTHPHEDHVFGLFSALSRYEIGMLVVSKFASEGELGGRLVELARERGIEVLAARAGDTLAMGECGGLKVLWPDNRADGMPDSGESRENDRSLVLELQNTTGQPLALLTADIGTEVERALLDGGAVRAMPILKVAHHGSRYSSTPEFVSAARPELAVVSVGKNSYGQPSESVLFRLRTKGSGVYRTDLDGSVVVAVRPDGNAEVISD